jgi:hypothetical protein
MLRRHFYQYLQEWSLVLTAWKSRSKWR